MNHKAISSFAKFQNALSDDRETACDNPVFHGVEYVAKPSLCTLSIHPETTLVIEPPSHFCNTPSYVLNEQQLQMTISAKMYIHSSTSSEQVSHGASVYL